MAGAISAVALLAVLALAMLAPGAARIVDPVARAATLSTGSPGYRLHLSLHVMSSALPTPITATANGIVDARDRAVSLAMAMNLGDDPQVAQTVGSGTLRMQEVLQGDTVYVKLPAGLLRTPGGLAKPWLKLDLAKLTGVPGWSTLAGAPGSADPTQMLEYLRSVTGSVQREGVEHVAGIATTHYRAMLSLDRVLNAVPQGDRATAEHGLAALEHGLQLDAIPVDVWVDAHHLLRRVELGASGNLPTGQTMRIGITIDVSDYGPQPEPLLPSASEVQDLADIGG